MYLCAGISSINSNLSFGKRGDSTSLIKVIGCSAAYVLQTNWVCSFVVSVQSDASRFQESGWAVLSLRLRNGVSWIPECRLKHGLCRVVTLNKPEKIRAILKRLLLSRVFLSFFDARQRLVRLNRMKCSESAFELKNRMQARGARLECDSLMSGLPARDQCYCRTIIFSRKHDF